MRAVIGFFGILILTGCTIIPGGHIAETDRSFLPSFLENDELPVETIVINKEIIEALENAPAEEMRSASLSCFSDYEYRIGKGDVLSIGVWDHPELTIPAAVQRTAAFDGFRVQSDGTVTFAYAPKIPAAGKTIVELHGLLIDRLSAVIEDPQVDIKVVGFNSQKVYVTGEVKNPGVLPITEVPLTVLDAVSQSGGLSELAAWEEVVLTRDNQSEILDLRAFYAEGKISCNRLLKDGDVIHVNRLDKHRVYVLGEVREAGVLEIDRYGLNLAEALSQVGGLKEDSANANGIFVLRRSELVSGKAKTDVYQLHAKDSKALIWASRFPLQENDIVYVTTAPIARWNRIITKLLPITRSLDDLSQAESRGNIL